MANKKHLNILQQGIVVWNEWKNETFEETLDQTTDVYYIHENIDLSGVDLCGANLCGADLSGVNLNNANLKRVELLKANLRGSYLSGANLYNANLCRTDLCNAHLSNANLFGTKLIEANIENAFLYKANLIKANLHKANLCNANLREANLNNAKLSWADLNNADIYGADLSNADLCKAHLCNAKLNEANFTEANLTMADLQGANLSYARLIKTNFEQAILANSRVYGISAWDLKLSGAFQNGLIVSPIGKPSIIVDSLELSQIIYMLLDHKKMRDIINAFTKTCVLILGRFQDGGLKILQSIAAELRVKKYMPIIFDFDRPDDRNYTETINTLVGLSKFVIVDLSGPSVPQELLAVVPHFKVPFIPIIEDGKKPYTLNIDILENPWVLSPIIQFKNEEHLIKLIPSKVIEPAEERYKERQNKLHERLDR
ncbi:MAG: pentapeptide repeat-containing protein [Methanothrix sp.]|nr:pentapeptide repeat-containing protein [Methanothrix sp.]MDD4447752.1 pentapeptide repeat-containing protein [Methanothrix sp.]